MEIHGLDRERLQERIPTWAQEIWARESERLAGVGLVPRAPGVRQVTLILLPDQRELKTPTPVDRVDELMMSTQGEFVEVASLDYADQGVRLRRSEIVGWFAAVYDDSIPEQRPAQVGGMPGSPLLPTRRGKG